MALVQFDSRDADSARLILEALALLMEGRVGDTTFDGAHEAIEVRRVANALREASPSSGIESSEFMESWRTTLDGIFDLPKG